MSSSLLAVVVDCQDPRMQADFWARVLNRTAVERNTDEFLVSDTAGSASLYFMKVPEPKVGKNRLHLDLVTDGPLEDEIGRLTALGARLVEVRHDPDTMKNPDTWAVLEDPEAHVFCVSSSATISGWV
jgi:Glyoxalase-like domain